MMRSRGGDERLNSQTTVAGSGDRPLRVLMLAPKPGSESAFALDWHVPGLARALSARGCEVHLAGGGPHTGKRLAQGRVRLYSGQRRPPFRAPGPISDALQEQAGLVAAVFQADADVGAFDVLHAHGWAGAAAAHALKRVSGSPLVFTLHRLEHLEPDSQQPEELAYIREVYAWICQEAERVICLSRFVIGEAAQAYGLPSDKAHLCPVAVDAEDLQTGADIAAFRELFGAGQGRLITFAGRLTRAKGPQVLLEAFPYIQAVVPDVRMAISGEGPLGAWLLRRAQELGVEAEVTFTGYLRGKVLATLLRSSDVFVAPSLVEASGQAAAEAMNCGTAVVASAGGGLRELIANEEDGLLVPPDNPKALAAGVVRMLYDGDLRGRLSANGRRRVMAGHLWQRAVDATLQAYAIARKARSDLP